MGFKIIHDTAASTTSVKRGQMDMMNLTSSTLASVRSAAEFIARLVFKLYTG